MKNIYAFSFFGLFVSFNISKNNVKKFGKNCL